MSAVPSDVRPAAVAVVQAADVLMLRWTSGALGGGEAADATLLRMLNDLDRMAVDLGEMEAARKPAVQLSGAANPWSMLAPIARLKMSEDHLLAVHNIAVLIASGLLPIDLFRSLPWSLEAGVTGPPGAVG